MRLAADVAVRLGRLDLRAALDASADEVVALVGPNGAGKTTLLRVLAVLTPIDDGTVKIGDLVLDDAIAGIHLAPERRPVGVVFQDHLLFPHLSVLDNVAYGLRARGVRPAEARRRAGGWLERIGLLDHASSRPATLSGGQAQRVALARALVTEPSLLLLDEPLSAVDIAAKADLRRQLRDDLSAQPSVRIVVTHDPVDAMALADRLVVLEEGRVTQQGPMAEVANRPRSPWVAQLVGLNLFRGVAGDGRLTLPDGSGLTVSTTTRGPAFALVHPRSVTVHRRPPEGSARNAWIGTAAGVHVSSDRVRVQVDGAPSIVAEVTPAAAAELRLAEGGPVWSGVCHPPVDALEVEWKES